MATDRTDENLSSYVHYLLEGSGAEHHLDFSQLRRELDSNASSSLSFKVAHSTPIQQNSTKRNILSPEEYPQRKDSSVSRFGLLEDERSRKSYVSTAERSRKTQSSPEHETEAGLGRAILAKVTKRLMNLGFDALHPSLLGSKQGLTYEQSFMMATTLNHLMNFIEEQDSKISSLEKELKTHQPQPVYGDGRLKESSPPTSPDVLREVVSELSLTKELLRNKEVECQGLGAKLESTSGELSRVLRLYSNSSKSSSEPLSRVSDAYSMKESESQEAMKLLCNRFQVPDPKALFQLCDSLESVIRALPPLENFILSVDACISKYSQESPTRSLDTILEILDRWGRENDISVSLRHFKQVMARELKCDARDATEYFVERIRGMQIQDSHDRRIVEHLMKLFEIREVSEIVPFLNDVFVTWAETNAGVARLRTSLKSMSREDSAGRIMLKAADFIEASGTSGM